MTTRRVWIRGAAVAAVFAGLGVSRQARAAPAKLAVAVPGHAVGAIVAAVGGAAVSIRLDHDLGVGQIRIGKAIHDVSHRILLKGADAARRRFLDDARNATKLGGNVRDALVEAAPEHENRFVQQHKAWSRPFAKKVLGWQSRLARSSVRGKRVRDLHGRIYLLQWAGADVDDTARWPGPPALAQLPREPEATTLPAYAQYLQRLVGAVT